MGKEIILSQFDNIEEKVEFLIEVCSSLKYENSDLKKRVLELEDVVYKKEETEKLNQVQREVVKGKVDSLITKLQSFTEINS